MAESTEPNLEAEDHIHRAPRSCDFEGKTVKRFAAVADNHWEFHFTDGTRFTIIADIMGYPSFPFMELCEGCSVTG